MLLYLLIAIAILLLLAAMRIAASPPFSVLGCFFASWAERCHDPLDE